MRRLWLLPVLALLVACAGRTPVPLAEMPSATAPVAESAPGSLPEPPVLNIRCEVDADCAVKNIGNCCGFMPACTNKASPTAPDLVLARCAGSSEEPICDHPMIYACLCEQGICRADPSVRSPGE